MLRLELELRDSKKTYEFAIFDGMNIIGSGTVTTKGVRLRWRGGNGSYNAQELVRIYTSLEEIQEALR